MLNVPPTRFIGKSRWSHLGLVLTIFSLQIALARLVREVVRFWVYPLILIVLLSPHCVNLPQGGVHMWRVIFGNGLRHRLATLCRVLACELLRSSTGVGGFRSHEKLQWRWIVPNAWGLRSCDISQSCQWPALPCPSSERFGQVSGLGFNICSFFSGTTFCV